MKLISLIMALLSLTLLLGIPVGAKAALWYGYCWGQKNSGVYCSPVTFSPSAALQSIQCQNWAQGQGALEWGQRRNTSQVDLKKEQADNCNYVSNLPKWVCYYKIADSTGLHSHHDLGDYKVFAVNGLKAIEACLQLAAGRYLEILKNLAPAETMRPAAIMTIP